MDVFTLFLQWMKEQPTVMMLYHLTAILAAAALSNLLVKRLLLRGIKKMLGALSTTWAKNSFQHRAIRRLANVVPALVVMYGVNFTPHLPPEVSLTFSNLCTAFIALTLALAASAVLDAVNYVYSQRPEASTMPIKGYLQVSKIVLFLVTGIMMIAAMVNKSPFYLFSGLGAMAAVLMLVFQDTILSLVASVQLTSNNMIRVGDWVQMPNLNADGDVIDIALHTVKIQNWDKTITTVPTRKLITDPFKNWRGMHESGGRRIKRPLLLDQNSVSFLGEEAIRRLETFRLLKPYLKAKEEEIAQWNQQLGDDQACRANIRRITNLGTFRAYVLSYLQHHPGIHQKMSMMVRQLDPTSEGLPLEIYCFTNDTRWPIHEGIQSDIFDHLLAILPEFGLRVFQNPSGIDFQALRRDDTPTPQPEYV